MDCSQYGELWAKARSEGEMADYTVVEFSEDRLVVSDGELTATSRISAVPFNLMKILYLSGTYQEGSEIPLTYHGLSASTKSPILRYAHESSSETERVCDTKVIFVREDSIKRSTNLQNIAYSMECSGAIHRVRLPFCWDFRKFFDDDENIRIKVGKFNEYTRMWDSKLATDNLKPNSIYECESTYPFCAKVVRTMPGAVLCITKNEKVLKVSRQDIAKGIDANAVLSPGDEIVVRFENGAFKFENLDHRIHEHEGINPLFDTHAKYRTSQAGGFRRSSDFRNNTLEHYNYTCCLCGRRLLVDGMTPMEAAHIIPRSRRGSNSLSNSLCLCPEHHWAFDRGLWSVNEYEEVVLSEVLHNDTAASHEYQIFSGEPLIFESDSVVSYSALNWHFSNIFRGHRDAGIGAS